MKKKHIRKGVYVIADPTIEEDRLLSRLAQLTNEDLAAIQIWDHPDQTNSIDNLLYEIIELYRDTPVPILINNRWELLEQFALDGVHFDELPPNLEKIQATLAKSFIKGVTLTNDLSVARTAEFQGFDYLSFCSIFPSQTSNSCERVDFKSISACREISTLPIFLAGGITSENMHSLALLPFDGIAIVSGIMNSDNTLDAWRQYHHTLTGMMH